MFPHAASAQRKRHKEPCTGHGRSSPKVRHVPRAAAAPSRPSPAGARLAGQSRPGRAPSAFPPPPCGARSPGTGPGRRPSAARAGRRGPREPPPSPRARGPVGTLASYCPVWPSQIDEQVSVVPASRHYIIDTVWVCETSNHGSRAAQCNLLALGSADVSVGLR